MDKRWMSLPRQSEEYRKGVDMFLEFAFSRAAKGNKILCPCKICQNSCWKVSEDVRRHLICDGFTRWYLTWVNHGEQSSSQFPSNMQSDIVQEKNSKEDDDICDLLRDIAGALDEMGDLEINVRQHNEDMESFHKLVDDAGKELYPGCKNFSKLRFMVRLLHIKFLGGWSDKSFDMLLELLKDVLPEGSSLPKNFNAAKNTVKFLGLGYTNIHACENDCILFWKKHELLNACPICNTSRWKSEKTSRYTI